MKIKRVFLTIYQKNQSEWLKKKKKTAADVLMLLSENAVNNSKTNKIQTRFY